MTLIKAIASRKSSGSLMIGEPGIIARINVPNTSIPTLMKFMIAEALALSFEVEVAMLAPLPTIKQLPNIKIKPHKIRIFKLMTPK